MKRLIIFPTDTVYGIGCAVFDKESIEKIYQIKNRDRSKPLPCLCANLKQVCDVAEINDLEKQIIQKFMPGALTLILKAKASISQITGFDTIGVRLPLNTIAQKVLIKYGPMLTTSVNESGELPLNNFKDIKKSFGQYVDKIYKQKEKSSGIASTVAKLENGQVIVLREGEIKQEEIESFIKNL